MFNNIPYVTKNLIIINGLFFLAKIALTSTGIDLDQYLAAFYPLSDNFKSYQVITHMFMHANFIHLLFNMYVLWMFGSAVEKLIGEKKFLILYFAAGLGSFILFNLTNYFEAQYLIDQANLSARDLAQLKELKPGYVMTGVESISTIYSSPMLGASGAVFGVLVAFAVLFPNATLMLLFPPIPLKAKYFIGIYVLLELMFAIQNSPSDHVAHYAHLGGAIIGYFLIRHWKKNLDRWN